MAEGYRASTGRPPRRGAGGGVPDLEGVCTIMVHLQTDQSRNDRAFAVCPLSSSLDQGVYPPIRPSTLCTSPSSSCPTRLSCVRAVCPATLRSSSALSSPGKDRASCLVDVCVLKCTKTVHVSLGSPLPRADMSGTPIARPAFVASLASEISLSIWHASCQRIPLPEPSCLVRRAVFPVRRAVLLYCVLRGTIQVWIEARCPGPQ